MTLFDFIPNARLSDPSTSAEAAAAITASGVRGEQAARVLEGVRLWPGKTSRELAALLAMDRHAVARRTSDLLHAGEVKQGDARLCTAGGRKAVTWWPCEQGA